MRSATPIERWSLGNAGGLILATAATLWFGALGPVLVTGGAALVMLVVQERWAWTPGGAFGRANAVTAVRLVLVLSLPFIPAEASPLWPIGVGLAVLLSDGLDGYLARRFELESEFGEFFDKETDALFLLVLCLMTSERDLLTSWVVSLGLLRYLFVVALFLLQPDVGKEYRSQWARYIYVGVVLSMLAAFLPYPALVQPVVALAAVALFYSFGRYTWWLWTTE